MKKLFPRTTSALLGAMLLLSPALTFAEEYTPFSVQTGGTGATTVEKAKENLEIPEVVQTAGTSETVVMSQKAVTDAIAAGSGGGIVVTQASGQSTTNVMSQKAVTDALSAVSPPTVVQITGTSTADIMSQKAVTDALSAVSQPTIVQITGTSTSDIMSQKAVTDTINAVPQTTVVQTTGQSISSVMSQKAVTDSILTAQNIFNMIWPVNSIYMSVSNVNPANLFGGTWVVWGSGRVPVCIDATQTEFNSVEKIGGHKLLQAHGHILGTEYGTNVNLNVASPNGQYNQVDARTDSTSSPQYANTRSIKQTGGGDAQNLQPYIVCYMWKRTA